MNRFLLLCLACIGLAAPAWPQQASFDEEQTSASAIRMTITNLGTIGNAFSGSFNQEGFSSCEFPAGSNIEHLFDGGIWIGAKVAGSDIVSTAALDDPSGYAPGKAGFEFTAPTGSELQERSSLLDSRAFSSEAVSHQDFVSDFTDTNTVVPGTQIQMKGLEQGPLGAGVHFEAYNWNFPFANGFTILNYTITNTSSQIWEDVHLGLWVDAVVRNVAVTPPFTGGGDFFDDGGNGYDDSLKLAYDFDVSGDPGFTDSYFGLRFLGAQRSGSDQLLHPRLDTAFKVFFNAWEFRDPGPGGAPPNDRERLLRMSSGLNFEPDWPMREQALENPSNRTMLLSTGPYGMVMPGESINLVYAVVLGSKFDDGNPTAANTPAQRQNLYENAFWAQSAFNGEDQNFNGRLDPPEVDLDEDGEVDPNEDLNGNGRLDPGEDRNGDGKLTRYVLPTPPAIPNVKMIAGNGTLDLFWDNNSVNSIDPISKRQDFEGYRIYKTRQGFDAQDQVRLQDELELVASFDSTGNGIGFDNGFASIRLDTPRTFPGDTTTYEFHYRFENLSSGWQHAVTLTAFDQGDEELGLQSLESSLLTPLQRVFPGTPPNDDFEAGSPFVYPNPYMAGAAWEGVSDSEEDRKIHFANLPARCKVRVYTVAGDLIKSFTHISEEYDGSSDGRWFQTFSNPEQTNFSGGEHAWNLLTDDNQIIARGLYLFAVEDLRTGGIEKGKFVVIR